MVDKFKNGTGNQSQILSSGLIFPLDSKAIEKHTKEWFKKAKASMDKPKLDNSDDETYLFPSGGSDSPKWV